MDVIEVIQKRRSVRSYTDKPVERDKIQRLLEAARLAPSASNRQEWRFVVVTDKKRRAALAEAANNQEFVAQAPVVIAACADHDGHVMRCGQACYPIDVAIATDHMTLQAVAEGLGTCWIGAFYEDQVKQILGIPEEIRVVELLTVGYAAGTPGPRSRLPLQRTVHWETW
ncbi:MAG: nitroreductase family protein [Phycisphaerales bacterium]|nr:MAG: nitroreductase family protein [Phycisphaerales bacterium]